LEAEVYHADDPESAQVPAPVDAGDRPHLERVWQILRKAAKPVLDHKTRVVSILLDGDDMFAADKVSELVVRLIKLLAPTVDDIARRSPNHRELSLKVEHEGGRREEIYLKKSDLVAKLVALQPLEKAMFAPLKIGQADDSSD
jgi:hypothetical protein